MNKIIEKIGEQHHFRVVVSMLLITVLLTLSSITPLTKKSYNHTKKTQIAKTKKPSKQQLSINKMYRLITAVSDIKDSDQRMKLAQAVVKYGKQYKINPVILISINAVESGFRKKVIGHGNCFGYYQINLNVHSVTPRFYNDPFQQTKKSCQILSSFLKIHNGKLYKGLNAYNGDDSNTNRYATKVLRNYYQYKVILEK